MSVGVEVRSGLISRMDERSSVSWCPWCGAVVVCCVVGIVVAVAVVVIDVGAVYCCGVG